MDELVKLVALCHAAAHSENGHVNSVDVKWVDPKGKKHVVVELKYGNNVVDIDWKVGSGFELTAKSPMSHYHEGRQDVATGEEAFDRALVLLGDGK